MERGNQVGLGTDVAAGHDPSMWGSCRMAVVASRALENQNRQQQKEEKGKHDASPSSSSDTPAPQGYRSKSRDALDYRHALYLATLGGARALGLDGRIGTLRVGMEFDALVLSAAAAGRGPVDVFPSDALADVFQKLCVLGDDRNVRRVFVQGRDVTVRGR
jgi:guanine deaminase